MFLTSVSRAQSRRRKALQLLAASYYTRTRTRTQTTDTDVAMLEKARDAITQSKAAYNAGADVARSGRTTAPVSSNGDADEDA